MGWADMMGYCNWSKVVLLLASCSLPQIINCVPHFSHHHSSHHPSSHQPSLQHPLSQQHPLPLTTHSLGNNVYGGKDGHHKYSYTSKGPWAASYQSVSRTFKQRKHKHQGQKPVWTQQPAWTQKPTQKPWVYPTDTPSTPPTTTHPSTASTPPPSPIITTTTLAPSTSTFKTTSATTILPSTTSSVITTPATVVPATTTIATTTTGTITTAGTTIATTNPAAPTAGTTTPAATTTGTTTPDPIPDVDFPFPSPLLPLEDIDLPAGPPAILRPGTRDVAIQLLLPRYRYLGTH